VNPLLAADFTFQIISARNFGTVISTVSGNANFKLFVGILEEVAVQITMTIKPCFNVIRTEIRHSHLKYNFDYTDKNGCEKKNN
jgi:hypothetical protein